MILGRVIRIRRRVVAPEQAMFRSAIVVFRSSIEAGSLGEVDVLVSRAVPPAQRDGAGEDALRWSAAQVVANEGGALRSARASAARAGRR